jgi:hypothetical protein
MSGKVPKAALHYLWHYQLDRRYRRRGAELVRWPAELEQWHQLWPILRTAVLDELRHRDITVETCPTSNLMIGGFQDLTHHPVFALDGTNLEHATDQLARVTVNTDDPGIFATNLENEMALLARAAEQRGEKKVNILRWIDHLRRQGIATSFLRDPTHEKQQSAVTQVDSEASLTPADEAIRRWRRFVKKRERNHQSLLIRNRIQASIGDPHHTP